MRVLVCGGRDFTDASRVFGFLDAFHGREPITDVAHGGAHGADSLADEWALTNGLPVSRYWPDWSKHGRAAGVIRNAEMLAEFEPDVVIAFPGGRGTADMKARATKAGVRVVEVAP